MGIEVKMRRRNSYGSSAGSHLAPSGTRRYPNREVTPRHFNQPGYPHSGPPPFIPNPDYVHHSPYEAPQDPYHPYEPSSAVGYPLDKSHRAHHGGNTIKLAYPKRSSHLSSGEENSQAYHLHHQPSSGSNKPDYPPAGSSDELKEIPVWSPYGVVPLQPENTIPFNLEFKPPSTFSFLV
ncbi:uncharacterized protein MELLADRAFT_91514 [Melampsora larici-populina 98AG31]|uniref:Uncharacterized protein n=1 Tax=Melampsora larici-populina (strain 98AG31 / pathotype 3-4-7) TaxID=747676 RepID=F4RZC1_MELLP|nr:uncharacterized protein MELLADRAFT_91514 [Melampsora larici-populina 98AG31]EGG02279.1 hypothetical protein MELLADRAFT_91514 [Melampsora larici-populina 98AG31]